MSPLKHSNNFAARMGRWSATHRKTAIFGWLAFVIVAVAVGITVGTKELNESDAMPGESGRAARILDKQFPQAAQEAVLIQSKSLTAEDPAFRAAIYAVTDKLEGFKIVQNIRSPLHPDNAGQISKDGHAVLVDFEFTGDKADAMLISEPVEKAVKAVAASHPEFHIVEYGDGSSERELEGVFTKDLGKAGGLSLPITAIILTVALGALLAAGIPLLLGLTSVIATMFLVALPSQFMPVAGEIKEVILLIGLAVGVDYALFYMKREREERAAGRSASAALEAAAATSGRSVLISGLTVMVAMAGMFLTGDKTFSSFALGTIMVVAIAMLGSLTVLPALLSKLGDRVEKGRIPFFGKRRRSGADSRVWGWILDKVLARPLVFALASAGVLLALAAPAVGIKLVDPGAEALPQNLTSVKAFNSVQKAFPGEAIPATVVVKADNVDDPQVQAAVLNLKQRALATDVMHEPVQVNVNPARTAETIDISLAGNGSDKTSESAVKTLREDIVPATLGTIDGVEVAVTGGTATSLDSTSAMKKSAPWVFGFVLLFSFLLLLVSFRSIVIAVKAVILNLLSVAAAYGVLVLVFQHGWGKGLLGFEYTGGIMSFLPVFLFVILFGLSMDYHVFILSRVREAFDRGMKTEDAVAHGIKSTAGVVTSAAIVMVFVFGVFGTLSIIMLKQFGVGLAAAVLIDATIVRAVLLPATMKLLGDWNWYLPKWLDWLPHLEHAERPAEVEAAPAPAAA